MRRSYHRNQPNHDEDRRVFVRESQPYGREWKFADEDATVGWRKAPSVNQCLAAAKEEQRKLRVAAYRR